jgi:hypothetical protein
LTNLEILQKLNSSKFEIEEWISAGTLNFSCLRNIDELNQASGKKLTEDELKRVKKDGMNAVKIIRKALGVATSQDHKRNPVEGGEMGSLLAAAGFPPRLES